MMLFNFRLSVFLTVLLVTATTLAHELAIGLSPFQERAAAKAQVTSTLQLMTDTLEPGESALIFDAYHLRSLGVFSVPNKSAYRHKKAKLQANRKIVKSLLLFAKQVRKPKGRHEPSIMGAIRLPQALRFIGENYPTTKESDLILLGNPLYDDPKEQDFTMIHNHIPGDGHFNKARNVTPYGIKGQGSLLTKQRVHLGFADETWMKDDHHGYFVKRLWTLFIEGQGGMLSTFTSDLSTLFQRVKHQSPVPTHAYTVRHTNKLEMILLRPPVVENEVSIYERPLTSSPLVSELLHEAPNVEIGLTWECGDCDLDLYVRKEPSSEILWYLNSKTAEGKYFKDWMRSPSLTNGYETVAYHVPIDLEQLFLAANFYGGKSSSGVKGELRISLDGQTYAKSFHLRPSEGNRGRGREETLATGQAVNPHWLVIDPLEVIGLDNKNPSLAKR